MSENAKKVLDYLKSIHGGDPVTAEDVAEALGLGIKSVNGIFTMALQRKGLGVRIPAEIELEDGTHKVIKFLELNEAGMVFDPEEVKNSKSDEALATLNPTQLAE